MKNGKSTLKVSKELELRLPDPAYAQGIFRLIDQQRVYLGRWLAWVEQTTTVEHVQDFIKSSRMFNRGGQRLTTFIFLNGVVIGSVALVHINKEHKRAEIGYWLSEEYQGQGFMTKCCKRIVDYTFRQMDINRLEIRLASLNTKSRAVPVRLGFQHEGTLREACYLNNTFYNQELYSMLKSDWMEQEETFLS